MIFLLIFLVADTLNNNIAPSNIIDPTICMKKRENVIEKLDGTSKKDYNKTKKTIIFIMFSFSSFYSLL